MKNGFSILSLIFTVLFLVLLAAGGIFYFQKTSNKPTGQDLVPTQVIDINSETEASTLTLQDPITPTNVPSDLGKIEGDFIFPSEFIPNTMKACAEDISTEEVICSKTLVETGLPNTFSFYVPAGTYYVYAQSGLGGQEEVKAYYSEFVTCGLLASCTSHEKIPVEVSSGETVSDIKPHDWYNF